MEQVQYPRRLPGLSWRAPTLRPGMIPGQVDLRLQWAWPTSIGKSAPGCPPFPSVGRAAVSPATWLAPRQPRRAANARVRARLDVQRSGRVLYVIGIGSILPLAPMLSNDPLGRGGGSRRSVAGLPGYVLLAFQSLAREFDRGFRKRPGELRQGPLSLGQPTVPGSSGRWRAVPGNPSRLHALPPSATRV